MECKTRHTNVKKDGMDQNCAMFIKIWLFTYIVYSGHSDFYDTDIIFSLFPYYSLFVEHILLPFISILVFITSCPSSLLYRIWLVLYIIICATSLFASCQCMVRMHVNRDRLACTVRLDIRIARY